MFAIDFTKPWLYKDVIYFNQGNLSVNNTLRCKLITGGNDDLEGATIICRFETENSLEISGLGELIDAKNGIIDIVFPSNSLVVGTNRLEILVNRLDKSTAQSPIILYDVWQGLTMGNGVEGETNYPILIDLVNRTGEVFKQANTTLDRAEAMQVELSDAIDRAYVSANNADMSAEKANSKIGDIDRALVDIDRALAAGTVDLELKASRDGEESLSARLRRDLFIGDKSLKQEVIDLGGLKEGQDMAYTADKGCLVCKETKNGTVKDLKVSGKSLVNLFESNLTSSLDDRIKTSFRDIGDNKEITFINFSDKPISIDINNRDTDTYKRFVVISPNSSKLINVGTNEKIALVAGLFMNGWTSSDIEKIKTSTLALEGDHTQDPPNSYFEGIASVGNEVDKIEVLSVKADGNLFVDELEVGTVDDKTGKPVTNINALRSPNFIRVDNANTYSLLWSSTSDAPYNEQACVLQYDKNKNYIKKAFYDSKCKSFTPDSDCCYIKFRIHKGGHTVYFGKYSGQYKPCESDKKAILFKDADGTWKPVKELRGLDTVCDTIELHSDGKYYYHQRTDIFIIDGVNTLFTNTQNVSEGNKRVGIVKPFIQNKKSNASSIMVMCDKIPSVTFNDRANLGIYVTCNDISAHNGIWWTNNIFENTDARLLLEEANNYVKLNPLTVIYPLAEEKVFEVNPLFLEAFEGETMMIVNSGVINAPLEFKIASYITNLVLLNRQRISMLEEQVIGMFKSVLNGDMRALAETLYPQDFVLNDDEIMLLNKL